jgi:hypothetical protein
VVTTERGRASAGTGLCTSSETTTPSHQDSTPYSDHIHTPIRAADLHVSGVTPLYDIANPRIMLHWMLHTAISYTAVLCLTTPEVH